MTIEPTQGKTPEQPIEPVAPVEPPATSAQQPAPEPVEEPFDKDRAMNTINKLREVEKQAKKEKQELEQLRAEKQKRAEAEMTEAQRLQKQLEEAQAQNARLTTDAWRTKAAAAANLPSIFADRIQGATEEEMLADARKLAEALPKGKTTPAINATNPVNASTTETEAQMRERLQGRNGKVFDYKAIQESGGGVVWNTNPNDKT